MKQHYRSVSVNEMQRCVCGKLTLPSAKAARKAIRDNAAKGHTLYSYRCDEARELHLTKRPAWDTRRDYGTV